MPTRRRGDCGDRDARRPTLMQEPPPEADSAAATPKLSRKELALRIAKWTGIVAGAGLVLAALTVVLVIRHYQSGLPSVAELKRYRPPEVTRILARDGTVLASVFVERRTVVPFA